MPLLVTVESRTLDLLKIIIETADRFFVEDISAVFSY